MAESIERWKNPEQRPQRAVSLPAHARRQHAQRNFWIVQEQWRYDSRAHRRAKRLVEILLKRKRALSGGGITRVKGRLGVTLLKRGNDAGGIGDGPAVEPQNGELALARRAPSAGQVVGAEHVSPVCNARRRLVEFLPVLHAGNVRGGSDQARLILAKISTASRS